MPAAAWIAFAALALTSVIQVALFAFFMGGLFRRVTALEEAHGKAAETYEKVIRLDEKMIASNAKLSSIERAVNQINRQMGGLATSAFDFRGENP